MALIPTIKKERREVCRCSGEAMRILIPSIVDLRKTAPNRLHHLLRFITNKHEITAICINDWWKADLVDTNKYYQDFKEILDKIDIRYISERNISPFRQEFLSRRLIDLAHNEDHDLIFNYNTLISGHHIAKELKLPMIYDLADDLPAMIGNSPQISRFARPIGKWIGKRALIKSIAISERVTGITKALQMNYSIPENKFVLLPNGVDTSLFRNMENGLGDELGLKDSFVLGYVGVLREWVDLTPVYKAVKGIGNAKLIIVGEEGLLGENKESVKRHGIEDRVIFTGTIPYNRVPEFISVMDVCLIPFKRNAISEYALPLKLFEYMACEKPVVSTKVQGVYENVGDRVLYANTADEYKTQIKRLMADNDYCRELGGNGRRFVIERYDWAKIGEDLERVIEGIPR